MREWNRGETMAEPTVTVSEFRVGGVLGRGFSILFSNIVPFGLLSLVLMSPPYIYALAVDPQVILDESEFSRVGYIWGVFVIQTLLSYLVTAALVYGTIRELRGRHASLGECIGRGLGLILPVCGVAILAGLLTGLAWLLFVIPGLIVWTMLWVAIPAAVVERPGVFASLSRSAQLTKGYRWRVFGVIVLIFVMGAVLSFIKGALLGGIANPTTTVLGDLVVTAFFTALGAVVSAVAYHDLRVVKEGADVEQIAAVFD